MFRSTRAVLVVAAVLTAAGEARAQYGYGYPRGYGGYGWGGWGSTAPSSMARGMGVFAMGRGMYNQQTAMARSMNANTAMRWNQFMFQGQQAMNRRYAARQRKRRSDI